MKLWPRLRSWMKAMSPAARNSIAEMQSELQFHIDSYAADLMRGGLSPRRSAAARPARAWLG